MSFSFLTEYDEYTMETNENHHNIYHACSLPFELRYQAALRQLAESMKRTQESRQSLCIKSVKTEGYARHETVASVLRSIEKSTRQVTTILEKNQEIQSSGLFNSNGLFEPVITLTSLEY